MSSKLRIAVWYNLPSGGGKRQVYDHVRGLKARGHEIVAFRPPVPQVDYLPISELVEEREIPLERSVVPDRGKLNDLRRELVFLTREREAMRRHSEAAAREIEAGGFDVLYANTCMAFQSPWVGRYVTIPSALYLGEPLRMFYEAPVPWPAFPEPDARPPFRQRVREFLNAAKNELGVHGFRRKAADELRNAQSYDRILTNSNFSRESIRRAYGLPSRVCYLGVDADRFENLGLAREPFVMSVGTFHASKDPEFAVRAVGSIRRDRPPLVWVANSVFEEERARVEAIARALEVDLQIRQYLSDAELRDLLNRATAFVYSPRLEPFGYAPLEANACGLPAVVLAEGGVKESVVDGLNGRVVPYRPEAMGEAIADLLVRPEEARAMGERAARHVREAWSLERATDELEQNLVEVAARSGG